MDGGTTFPELATAKLSLTAPQTADSAGCALCADGVAARMARQFGLLERLGAVTVMLVEALGEEAAKYPNSSGADAFVQVARALRQTIALEMRLDAEREARERSAAAVAPRRAAAPDARRDDAAGHDDVTDDAIDDAVDHRAHQDRATGGRAVPLDGAVTAIPREQLLRGLRDRPDPSEMADELRGLPSGEVVGRICQMLGIEADLSCFTDQEMGRRAAMNHPPLPRPPAPLSNAAFAAALGRPSAMPAGLLRPAVSPNLALRPDHAAAGDAACDGGGHDPPAA